MLADQQWEHIKTAENSCDRVEKKINKAYVDAIRDLESVAVPSADDESREGFMRKQKFHQKQKDGTTVLRTVEELYQDYLLQQKNNRKQAAQQLEQQRAAHMQVVHHLKQSLSDLPDMYDDSQNSIGSYG